MTTPVPIPPSEDLRAALRSFAERTLGRIVMLEDRSRTFGRLSLVWHIEAADGHHYYLKRHEDRRLYDRELRALTDWLPRLPEGARQMTVPLVATADDLDAMLFAAAPGEIVEDAALTTEERHAAYQLAGAFAAALHALPCEGCGPAEDYGANLRSTIRPWLADPAAAFTAEEQRWATDTIRADGALDAVRLVPAHMDYSPRNWLIHRADGALWLYVIDWERARPAPWTEDVQRMAEDHWHADPVAREAFFLGYGRQPSDIEERQIRALAVANNAIGAIA
ncbi:MAG: phosphotransferase [Chloroflexi bacterium]|nr:phosphotransferase [Chloroflexota bacterium]MDA1145992.1 phosphotransferase [Chloroflexota bacterium]